MSKLLSLSVDVSKITKDKLYQGKKGTYLKLTVSLQDDKDQFGNDVTCWEEQSQEERNSKSPKNYLGNGKVFWSSEPPVYGSEPVNQEQNDDPDLPF